MTKFTEIKYVALSQQINEWLKRTYNKAGNVFTPASPFGQLLEAFKGLFALNNVNIKNITDMHDVYSAAAANKRVVRSLARVGQYDPQRAHGATGSILIKPKAGADITRIGGNKVVIRNYMRIKNTVNALTYVVKLNTDSAEYAVTSNGFAINVIQGKPFEQSFTGTGTENQSYSVQSVGQQDVDQHEYSIYVDDKPWQTKGGFNDLLPNEEACWTRTGIDGAMDVYFGNGQNGMMPSLGSKITVKYLLTDGTEGNIPNPQVNEFKFIDEITDAYGEGVDFDELFDIFTLSTINYGADGESPEFTRSMLPYVNTNNVLLLPKHFEFFVKRLGVYSIVDVYTTSGFDPAIISEMRGIITSANDTIAGIADKRSTDISLLSVLRNYNDQLATINKSLSSLNGVSTMNIMAVPNVLNYYGPNTNPDYFTIPIDYFLLDADEADRLKDEIIKNGNPGLNLDINIVQPTVKSFVCTCVVKLFKDADEQTVKSEMRRLFGEYMLGLKRRDAIPPSDLIAIMEGIDGIDSADISFISKTAEDYHIRYNQLYDAFVKNNGRVPLDSEITIDGKPYDRYYMGDIDQLLGDFTFEKGQLPMMRGGWSDRNGVYYADNADGKGYCSLNILVMPKKSTRLTNH